jgi:hypothetical protein
LSVQFLAQVWADPYFGQTQKSELLVALAIADFARKEDGKAWPSIETLARKARTSVRQAQEACRTLEKAGKLRIEPGGGQNGTNAYFLLCAPQPVHPPSRKGCTVSPRNGPAAKPSAEPAVDCAQTIRNHKEPQLTGTTLSPSPPEVEEGSGPMCGFEGFWQAYPRKKEKGDAERAWKSSHCAAIADRITAAVITAAGSADWKRNRGQYIPFPGKWLRRRGWEDEQTPSTDRSIAPTHICSVGNWL